MSANKDIIIRIVLGFFLIIVFIKVIGPVIFEMLKKKIPGSYEADNDIDSMIRRQKERLRSQYGLPTEINRQNLSSLSDPLESITQSAPPTKEIETLYKESRWGGGAFSKDIQTIISKNYSYTLAETKVNAFVLIAEKKKYLNYLSSNNQASNEAIKNYLSLVLLFLTLVDEIRNKELSLLEKVAKKCHVDKMEFMLALQLKVLFAISGKMPIKEEGLYESTFTLHQYSEETIKEAMDLIFKKDANYWAKGHSIFFEELSLNLSYADIMTPYPLLVNKSDYSTAYKILKIPENSEPEDIKKAYKKLAMVKHPDKIGHMNLPKILEKKAVFKFNQIQAAYDILMAGRKK
jgi:DnaJ-domain-containing protein 1